ncbi:DUF3788 domain-containing protein [Alkaliphilus peptidifermentans]|uniref:DUF3788 domain-containing protein n=1 Tax=Alkaliphilus peptidifermentans DSM 18978 TaxID=1120976 RepID=A0A1G5KVC1_9FIRM|nr:DUF3788 domain-containing protein [Alkaliphilus peptidifermentans]SCZ04527.1 Protein of unknown function [Alkaliphilus peptidifermentans DSM 18978]
MMENMPTEVELSDLLGENRLEVWRDIVDFVEKNYNYETVWNKYKKTGKYELKFRRSGKTLCSLYPQTDSIEVLIVFGKKEREKFEASRNDFSEGINSLYDNTHQYHDGKWMYINLKDEELVDDIKRLIIIKKEPNKK